MHLEEILDDGASSETAAGARADCKKKDIFIMDEVTKNAHPRLIKERLIVPRPVCPDGRGDDAKVLTKAEKKAVKFETCLGGEMLLFFSRIVLLVHLVVRIVDGLK